MLQKILQPQFYRPILRLHLNRRISEGVAEQSIQATCIVLVRTVIVTGNWVPILTTELLAQVLIALHLVKSVNCISVDGA